MELTFQDTQIAFKHKTDKELKRTLLLFKIISNPYWVSIGKHLLGISLRLHLPIKWLLGPTLFRHFCGGESVESCSSTIDFLCHHHIDTILDYSAEGIGTETHFRKTYDEVSRVIEKAGNHPNLPFAVFKPSGLCHVEILEKISMHQALGKEEQALYDTFEERLEQLCQSASAAGIPIMVDAEESWIQPAVDRLIEQFSSRWNRHTVVICNTLQMYRHDRLAYLKDQHEKAVREGYLLGFKLVRGAYWEKEQERAIQMGYPSPVYLQKQETDEAYDEAVRFCVEHVSRILLCAGTHNETSCRKMAEYMRLQGISPSDPRLYFSQLYGMSDHISFSLAEKDYHVAKYLPYGPIEKVMPYLIRRAEENTAIRGQSGRELQLIRNEKRRRAGKP